VLGYILGDFSSNSSGHSACGQDEISEKTGLHLKSCRRQFDNIKRIFKVIEEMPGHYVKNIEAQVTIPPAMIRSQSYNFLNLQLQRQRCSRLERFT
jgi:hypothetical protein